MAKKRLRYDKELSATENLYCHLKGENPAADMDDEDAHVLDALFSVLPERTENVLRTYYGVGAERKERTEIAEDLGVSTVSVSNIIHKGLQTLRDSKEHDEFLMYFAPWEDLVEIAKGYRDEARAWEAKYAELAAKLVIAEERVAFLEMSRDEQIGVLGLRVDRLDLSGRVMNAFKRADKTHMTIGELTRMSERQLLKMRNIGQKCIEEIEEKLALHGLKLAEEYDVSESEGKVLRLPC